MCRRSCCHGERSEGSAVSPPPGKCGFALAPRNDKTPRPSTKPSNNAVIYSTLDGGNSLRYLDRVQPLALLVLRVVLGVVMIGHGYGKVFGGLSHHVQFVS